MTGFAAIQGRLSELLAARPAVDERTDEGQLNALSGALTDLQTRLREEIQSETAADIANVVTRLESGAELSPRDVELIRLWIVSDADGYVHSENDYQGWIAELNRLLGEMGRFRDTSLDAAAVGRLSGIVRDAARVVADVSYYKEQKGRVEAFDAAITRLTPEDRRAVARVLRHKLSSDRM